MVGGNMGGRKEPLSEELALASDVFDKFCNAPTLKLILGHHRHLCELLRIKPTHFPNFYPKLKSKLCSWKAQALWTKFDKRASHKCYNRGKACPNTRVLVIGAGPCGMRAAIEAQLLGAKVVVVEKRDRLSRNNVLHLWPFVIHDLRALGAKKFFGKFCAGAIDHISIRQLQCLMLKIALLLGVEIHEGVGFEGLVPPPEDQNNEKIGWRAEVSPPDHPVSQYEFDVLIGADGKRNTLEGFKRKEFRGKLAIAITVNFINRRTKAEARVEEISGVAFIFNQKFFKDLLAETGIDLENIVYYKDETHYFVMTAKKPSLINKGVIIKDFQETAKLLASENVDKDALQKYAREAADFSTNYQLPDLEFAVNHYGQPDVAMFDFTSMFAAENASRVIERRGHKLLLTLVGDSLLEPFWPTGSGCARGFLSSMDACWAIKSWGSGQASVLEVLAERESIYRILAQTTPENLQRDYNGYTLDPYTRYTKLNHRCVTPSQVRGYFDTDDPAFFEEPFDSTLLLSTTPPLPSTPPLTITPHLPSSPLASIQPLVPTQPLPSTPPLIPSLPLVPSPHLPSSPLASTPHLVSSPLASTPHLVSSPLASTPHLVPSPLASTPHLVPSPLASTPHLVSSPLASTPHDMPKKRRRKDSQVHPDSLLLWLKKQVALYKDVEVEDMTHSFKNGMVLCAVIHRYRPDLIDFHVLHPDDVVINNQLAFDTLERELGIPPMMTGQEMEQCEVPDRLKMLAYLSQIYDTFRGEIPHIKYPKLDESEGKHLELIPMIPKYPVKKADPSKEQMVHLLGRITSQHHHRPSPGRKRNSTEREPAVPSSPALAGGDRKIDSLRRPRKRRSTDKERMTADREARLRAEIKAEMRKGGTDEDFTDRIKTLEEKLKGIPVSQKKPKDLLRAIGKIEKTDWNVKEIEKKIEENKMGRSSKHNRAEKVPKWSREQFDDKFQAVKMKLQKKSAVANPSDKYNDVDVTLKRLDKKIKEGSAIELGPKVSVMAEQFAVRTQEPDKPTLQRSNSKAALFLPTQGSSETCHFCAKRVYLMERMNAEGKLFHRGCFRCEYCNISLRLGNYGFDRDGKFGSRFFCMQHFGMKGTHLLRIRRRSEELKSVIDKENIPAITTPKTPIKAKSLCEEAAKLISPDMLDSMSTPERIEFENLAGAAQDVEETPSEMDEDEWTDRNFGASAAEGSSDDDMSDSEDEEEDVANEVFEEAIDQPVPVTADATRRLAETWTRRYSKNSVVDVPSEEVKNKKPELKGDDEDDDDDSDSYEYEDSDADYSYHEYDSGDDESETATEGEDDIIAREQRKQEVRLEVPQLPRGRKDSDTGSDTEIASDEYTSTESESEEVENSATEIETDSEFEHDGTTPTHEIPAIMIDDSNVTRRKHQIIEEPKKVQVRTSHILRPINGTVGKPSNKPQPSQEPIGVKLKFSPLRPEMDSGKSTSLSNLTAGNNIINASGKLPATTTPTPFINPRRGDYFLNRTHSTEGIASKLSLELKKKYLFGNSGFPGSVKKSGSATTLDSKVKSFVDIISEHQKLLHPAPEPSPTMQAFLQGTSKLSVSSLNNNPLSPPSPAQLNPPLKPPLTPSPQSTLNLRKQKELPFGDDSFEHVCHLGRKKDSTKQMSSLSEHSEKSSTNSSLNKLLASLEPSLITNGSKNSKLEHDFLDAGLKKNESGEEMFRNVSNRDNDVDMVLAVESSLKQNEQLVKERKEKVSDYVEEQEADCRPRSPAHETSIVVPEVLWKVHPQHTVDEDDIESDSLSSSDSASELEGGESDDNSESASPVRERTPPRVEIHDSSGELMVEGVSAQEKEDISEKSNVDKKTIEVPSSLSLDIVSTMETSTDFIKTLDSSLSERKLSSVTSERSSPSTPPSMRGEDSESYHNEATLAETELSDWAQDADVVVSEDLEDVEFNIDPDYASIRRQRKAKNVRKGGKVLAARIARGEDFGDFDDPGHICGLKKEDKSELSLHLNDFPNNVTSRLLSGMENIEFMDMADENDSETDEVLAATNSTLLKNRGYVKFVNSFDEDDLVTPIVETQTMSDHLPQISSTPTVLLTECEKDADDASDSPETMELLSHSEAVNAELVMCSAGEAEGTTTEETTTSEVVTIKDSPIDATPQTPCADDRLYTLKPNASQFLTGNSNESALVEDASKKEYEEYVQRLEGRMSAFSNVRDSIDIRKSRRKNKSIPQKQEKIVEDPVDDSNNQDPALNSSMDTPSTSQKLEVISRERLKQKDLIHEMVMNKLLTQKKNSQDKKVKRSHGSITSPISSPGFTPIKNPFDSLPQSSENKYDEKFKFSETVKSPLVGDQKDNILNKSEVPLSNDSFTDDPEKFYTPLTSFKKRISTQLRHRPVSVHASFKSHRMGNSFEKPILPDTPLTNPEAFSLPDIRKALFKSPDDVFRTPVPPPRTRHEEGRRLVERERQREEARSRARLKSDEELGLSPEDYIKSLKLKVRYKGSQSSSSKRPGIVRCLSEPGNSPKDGKSTEQLVEEIITKSLPIDSETVLGSESRKAASFSKLSTSPNESSITASSSSQPNSKATFYLEPDLGLLTPDGEHSQDRKKSKDRERRKSIIQAVSDFFHKKKDSPGSSSPPKNSATSGHATKDKFSRFKFTKGKDKGKQEKSSSTKEHLFLQSKDTSGPSSRRPQFADDLVPPPIPPPPANYQGSNGPTHRMSEESLSDAEEDSKATTFSTSTHEGAVSTTKRKQSRINLRIARQAQLKRLRMAQEIQRQLEEVEVKQRELEQRGVSVEKALRGEGADLGEHMDESELLREWFDLMQERSDVHRYERELMVRAQEMELEDRHARLQQELRDRMSVDDSNKSRDDVAKEGQILKEMLEIVERRDALILLLEKDRQRCGVRRPILGRLHHFPSRATNNCAIVVVFVLLAWTLSYVVVGSLL